MGKWVRTHENWVKPNSRTGNVTTTKSSFGKLHSNKSTGQTNRVRINRWLLELYQARLKCVESVQHTDYACEILSLHHGKAISRRSRYIYIDIGNWNAVASESTYTSPDQDGIWETVVKCTIHSIKRHFIRCRRIRTVTMF